MAVGGRHGVPQGGRGCRVLKPCAGAMQSIANGDGLRLKKWGVAWAGGVRSHRSAMAAAAGDAAAAWAPSRRAAGLAGRSCGGPGRAAGHPVQPSAPSMRPHAVHVRCGQKSPMSGTPEFVPGCAPMPAWIGGIAGDLGSALRACRPDQGAQAQRCSGGSPLRSVRTAGCSTARRGRSGCRSGPMRRWCRRRAAHGVRPRPGCGCRRWCGSAAASRKPARCWPDR